MGKISKRLRNDTFTGQGKQRQKYDVLHDDIAVLDKG